jgi:hypothetical protein
MLGTTDPDDRCGCCRAATLSVRLRFRHTIQPCRDTKVKINKRPKMLMRMMMRMMRRRRRRRRRMARPHTCSNQSVSLHSHHSIHIHLVAVDFVGNPFFSPDELEPQAKKSRHSFDRKSHPRLYHFFISRSAA